MNLKPIILASVFAVSMNAVGQVAHFDMTLSNGCITETNSGKQSVVNSQLKAFTVEGIKGDALRFDGYSNYVVGSIPAAQLSTDELTVSILLATETYPMMNTAEAENTPTYGLICGNLDETAKTGFAFELSSQGNLRFRYGSSNGFLYTIKSNATLERGKWNCLTVVLSKSANKSYLYLNGTQIGSSSMSGVKTGSDLFYIGKDSKELKEFGAHINTFCGLIDDIAIYNEAFSADKVASLGTSFASLPDFCYPESRYSEGVAALWRPQFHGMPSGGWTNESHGLTYSDGKYHVFFQKNANGPYMARLHWGHISSANLCKWTEEPIAFGPSESYDIKGCWSGCVFEDGSVTGGKIGALYTAVDNAKATICLATSADNALLEWTKSGSNPIINGRPQGLSDDFRDPYFFTANGQKYIVVGTSKNGLGACTLHKYNNGVWSNDGSIFFQATNAHQHGTFWEMPNITDMGNGKWLFTCTPLNTGSGVRTLYWLGSIDADGKFIADSMTPQYLEMGGVSKDGYGLLSPSIFQHNGKTIMLGIVPDKLATEQNLQMGWAHNYSLPREICLSADGKTLWQKPCSLLESMRTSEETSFSGDLQGVASLAPVSGRHIEMLGEFTVGNAAFGFNFLKTGSQKVSLSYTPANNQLALDLTALQRQVNDGVYGGVYKVTLPERPAAGEKLKLHVFFDGSIADIFVADKWAFSVRVFPTDANAVEAEVFADSTTSSSVHAWVLDADASTDNIESIHADTDATLSKGAYNILGQKVAADACGIVICNGKKYVRN